MKEGRVINIYVTERHTDAFQSELESTLNTHLAKGWTLKGTIPVTHNHDLQALLVFTRTKKGTKKK